MKFFKSSIILLLLFPLTIFGQSSGTGFIISDQGFIITCHHVVEDAESISVKGMGSNFTNEYQAKIVAEDEINDLALLKIDGNPLKSIPYAISWDNRNVGDDIFTLGYPLRKTMGEELKLTNGIISSKSGYQGDVTSYQISAPIHPGNSGGPLFDKNGYIVGVINAKHTKAENTSYAVKSSIMQNLIQSTPYNLSLSQKNTLSGKPLAEQVKNARDFILIIEAEKNSSLVNNQNFNSSFKKNKVTAKLKLRPEATATPIYRLVKDTRIKILGESGSYYKVQYEGDIYYSHEMYFK